MIVGVLQVRRIMSMGIGTVGFDPLTPAHLLCTCCAGPIRMSVAQCPQASNQMLSSIYSIAVLFATCHIGAQTYGGT